MKDDKCLAPRASSVTAVMHPSMGRSAQTLIQTASWHLWVDIVVKIVFGLVVLMIIFAVWWSVSSDISAEQQKNEERARNEAQNCADDYDENNCDNPTPALKKFCAEKKFCREYQPGTLPATKLGARYLGSMVNDFLEPFSLKSIATVLILGLAAFWFRWMKRAEPPFG
jgi:hypothetical protein